MTHYLYHIPGRVRIKNPVLKNNLAMLDELRDCFEAADGIDYITTNPLTGSAVINYDSRMIHPTRIMQMLKKSGYFNDKRSIDFGHSIENSMEKTGW